MRAETHLQSQQKSNGSQERYVYLLNKIRYKTLDFTIYCCILVHSMAMSNLSAYVNFGLFFCLLSVGLDQALQPDTEQTRKEEAT